VARRYVGIDFGTSTTLVAFREGDQEPRVVPIGHVTSWMPSVVGVDGSQLRVGEDALKLSESQQLRSVKSLLTAGVQRVRVGETEIDVRDAVRALVAEAIRRSEEQIPGLFRDAEVFAGCPALWTGTERRLLVEVFHECGLDLDIGELIDEPIAAGLQWVHDEWRSSGQRLSGRSLIFDAGGGTLDIAYLEAGGIDRLSMTVLSAEGVGESGDVLDATIAEDLLAVEPPGSVDSLVQALTRGAARDVKEALSSQDLARAITPAQFARHFELTRDRLEELFAPQLNRATGLAQATVRGSLLRFSQPLSPSQIRQTPWEELSGKVDHVALVGGLSHVPAVANALAGVFPASTVRLVASPQESVVKGLTYGAELEELNLPRPPVGFFLSFPEFEDRISADWLQKHRQVYVAFTPLYEPDDVRRGNDKLGFDVKVPSPSGLQRNYEVVLRCVMPTRSQVTVRLRFTDGSASEVVDGISLIHNGRGPIRFKLYTNGDLAFSTSNGHVTARVEHWPTLRGPQHDYQREIRLHRTDRGSSRLRMDDWRFQ